MTSLVLGEYHDNKSFLEECVDNFIYETKPDEKMRRLFFEKVQNLESIETALVGRSILSREILALKIGHGSENIVYVGAHHGSEYITSSILMRFVLFISEKATRPMVYMGINTEFLLQKFTFWIIPCANPDGVELAINGITKSPLYERQMRMNGNSDFFKWQANSRGVDLNRNYPFGFSEYKAIECREGIVAGKSEYSGSSAQSEPETRAVVGFIHALSPSLIVSLYSQGEEVYYSPKNEKEEITVKLYQRNFFSITL